MASCLCLESSWPPTQGPHHYSQINLKVNLLKPVSQKGFRGNSLSRVACLRHLYIGRHQPLVALHHIVISDLTVYTRKPTGRGLTGSFLWVVTRGWRVPLSTLTNNFALCSGALKCERSEERRVGK